MKTNNPAMFYFELIWAERYNLKPLSLNPCVCSVLRKRRCSGKCLSYGDIHTIYECSNGARLLLIQSPIYWFSMRMFTWTIEKICKHQLHWCVMIRDGWFSPNYGTIKVSDQPIPYHSFAFRLDEEWNNDEPA